MEISKCYENLAHTIIMLAVKDYKKALKNDNRRTKRECERFFRSEWFDVLTRIDGNMLIDKLRAEVKRI